MIRSVAADNASVDVPRGPSGNYLVSSFSDLCWLVNNSVLRKDTLSKCGFTFSSFVCELLQCVPICDVCGKQLEITSLNIRPWCSTRCYHKSHSFLQSKKLAGINAAISRKNSGKTKNAWSIDAREKRQQTNIERYGHPTGYCAQTESKRKNTLLEKYGADSAFDTPAGKRAKELQKQTENTRSLSTLLQLFPNFENVQWDGHAHTSIWRCIRCKSIFSVESTNPHTALRCPHCDPAVGSLIQKQLFDILQNTLSCDILYNTRKIIPPQELDIWIPAHNVAVEINGLYWHSFAQKETKDQRNAALNKWLKCRNNDITLMTFFEDELVTRFGIVVSMILAKCGIFEKKISASKLDVIKLTAPSAFFDKYHLRGSGRLGNINLGLTDGNEIFAALSVGYNKQLKQYELIRFAVKTHFHVYGALSKLLKSAKNQANVSHIITYADKCHSIGKAYSTIGTFEKDIPPGYYWWKNNLSHKLSRQHFQKSKLKTVLGENYDPEKTEADNMFSNGWRRIWDCGHLRYVI